MSSDRTKITILGAGSYIHGRSLLYQALAEHRLSPLELVLVDADARMLEWLAAAAGRLINEFKLDVQISCVADRTSALPGSDYVILIPDRHQHKLLAKDIEVIDRHYGSHLVSEDGGVAGISYALRQLAQVERLVEDLKTHCPEAWLLCLSRPLARICQFTQAAGIRTAGFCASSLQVYHHVWRLLADGESYSPEAARARFDLVIGGLNHFSWLLEASDRESGEDLMPRLRQAIKERKGFDQPRSEALFRGTGYMPLPDDQHIQAFLEPDDDTRKSITPGFGNPHERDKQKHVLTSIADGSMAWETMGKQALAERPFDFVAGMSFGKSQDIPVVNLPNGTRCPVLPEGVFIEAPARVGADGLQVEAIVLPKPLVDLCVRTAEVSDAIVQVARKKKMFLMEQVIERDPTIDDKKKGFNALAACLDAHAELLW